MKHIALITALLFVPVAASAQEEDADIGDGLSLMEQGARELFRGLLQEMEPAIDEFDSMTQEIGPALEMLASEMGPALLRLFNRIDDIQYYTAPEVLPNGDIIIRRDPDAPPYEPFDDDVGDETDDSVTDPVEL